MCFLYKKCTPLLLHSWLNLEKFEKYVKKNINIHTKIKIENKVPIHVNLMFLNEKIHFFRLPLSILSFPPFFFFRQSLFVVIGMSVCNKQECIFIYNYSIAAPKIDAQISFNFAKFYNFCQISDFYTTHPRQLQTL